MGALIMRTVISNFLGTWTQASYRYNHLHGEFVAAILYFSDESYFIIQEAFNSGNWSRFVDEIGKRHLDMAGVRTQLFYHGTQNALE